MSLVQNVTTLLSLRNLDDVPKWAVGVGVVVSIIYLINNDAVQDRAAQLVDDYLPPNVRRRTFRTGRAGDFYE
ncbi:MAG: hypothetical protein AAGF27_06695 [Pseudomonadota bacterium]